MAALEEALSRWARLEMELPPSAVPSGRVLRRLCSGSCVPIWEFIISHVRHPRNVQKIRGNLVWYQQLEQMEGAGPAPPTRALQGAVSRLRQELGVLGGALAGAQEAVLDLEAELGAGLSQRGAELRRGLELRLVGAAAAREGERLRRGRDILRTPQWPGQAGPGLAAAAAVGMEPEVLASVRAVCRLRARALEATLEPRPLGGAQELSVPSRQRWLQEAEALLSRHPPGAVLWALERLALESTRAAALGGDLDPDCDPDLDPEAPPTVKSLIQECWVALGGMWGSLPPLAARLHPLRPRLAQLRHQLAQRLGGDPKTQEAARLALEVAGLSGGYRALIRGVQELRGARGGPPKLPLGELRHQLHRRKHRLAQRQLRLRALARDTRTLKGQLRPLQARARGVAQSTLSHAPPALAREGERLRQALGALGALGAPLPRPAPDPLTPVCHALGVSRCKPPQGALLQAAELRRELRGRGLWAWPKREAGPPLEPLPPLVGGASGQLLPRLRLVADQCRRRLEAWPRLQELVSQWWEQPAQWAVAPPPGGVPFSYWLQRWSRAAQALAPPCPRPLPLAPPTAAPERRRRDKPRP